MSSEADAGAAILPRANPDLLGQESAEAAFLAAWRSRRVPHAWLLAGPRGVGKATFAYRVARFVLAGGETSDLALPPDHPTFRRVAALGHGDLMALMPGQLHPDPPHKPTREIVVGHVRAVSEFLTRTAAEGGWRVAIIDTAEAMNRNAANALLKILEEPPTGCLLLLTSNAPGRLLPTVRSRCRTLLMPRLDDQAVETLLERYRPELKRDDAAELARLAGGSIGRALELNEFGGLELHRTVDRLLAGLPRLNVPAVHAFADELGRPGKDQAREHGFALALELMADWVAAQARRLAGDARVVESWLAVWDKIGQLQLRADAANLDRKLVLLDAFFALAAASRGAAIPATAPGP